MNHRDQRKVDKTAVAGNMLTTVMRVFYHSTVSVKQCFTMKEEKGRNQWMGPFGEKTLPDTAVSKAWSHTSPFSLSFKRWLRAGQADVNR